MLNIISWQGYWTNLALTSTDYYAVVCFLYYRNDDFTIIIPKEIKGAVILLASPAVTSYRMKQNQSATAQEGGPSTIDYQDFIRACIDKLAAFSEESERAKAVKAKFIFPAQCMLSKYPSLKGSSFQKLISNLIVLESEHTCSLHLREEDLFQVCLNE